MNYMHHSLYFYSQIEKDSPLLHSTSLKYRPSLNLLKDALFLDIVILSKVRIKSQPIKIYDLIIKLNPLLFMTRPSVFANESSNI